VGLRGSGEGQDRRRLGVLLLRPACQAVESKHRVCEGDGGETVRGGGGLLAGWGSSRHGASATNKANRVLVVRPPRVS